MVLNSTCISALPLTFPERLTEVTCPRISLPAGRRVSSPFLTSSPRWASTTSSGWAETEETVDSNTRTRFVPAGTTIVSGLGSCLDGRVGPAAGAAASVAWSARAWHAKAARTNETKLRIFINPPAEIISFRRLNDVRREDLRKVCRPALRVTRGIHSPDAGVPAKARRKGTLPLPISRERPSRAQVSEHTACG